MKKALIPAALTAVFMVSVVGVASAATVTIHCLDSPVSFDPYGTCGFRAQTECAKEILQAEDGVSVAS